MDEPGGYDPAFLGASAPLPGVPSSAVALAYTHFTVLLDPGRRLAAATAVNVDGAQLREVPRADDWRLDPRVPAQAQAGEELYAGNDLDRGHLVRRRDPVWGSEAVAARASADTFVFPNAAPQVSVFNQSKDLWNGLEDHVLEHARVHRQRLCVLTGPVLAPDDPLYRQVQLPRRFWKVVAWATGEGDDARELATTAYVLDQSALLSRLRLGAGEGTAGTPAPTLGAFRTFQVPVAAVAGLTGLALEVYVAGDRLQPVAAEGGGDDRLWRELRRAEDVDLGGLTRP